MSVFSGVRIGESASSRWSIPFSIGEGQSDVKPSIHLVGEPPQWLTPVAMRIAELAALPTVDPRGSRELNLYDVVDALKFIVRVMRDDTVPPWIGRLASGGIQLTWQAGDVEVEAVFDRARGDREILVSVGENEWDAPADEADSLFATVIDRLSASHFEQASA